MRRKLAITTFAMLLLGLPALAENRAATSEQTPAALHLMNDTELALFLTRLDGAVTGWKSQLGSLDVKSLGVEAQDSAELDRSLRQCAQSLSSTHEDIRVLSQKQTLRFDLLLLVDLNDLARNLDGLDRDLASSASTRGTAQKSVAYVKEVLGIDAAVGEHTAAFQNHVLAFAKVVDATLQQVEDETDKTPGHE